MIVYLSAPIQIKNPPMVKPVEGSSNSVNITWLPPVNNSDINGAIVYDIQCYICVDGEAKRCSKSCKDLSYSPSQYNVTKTCVRVSGLVHGQTYQFKIFPKNSLNKVIPKEQWKFVKSDPYPFKSEGNIFCLCII